VKKINFVIAGTGLPEIITLAEDFCNHNHEYQFVGFIDDNLNNRNRRLYGYTILGGFDYRVKDESIKVVNSISRNSYIRNLSTKKLLNLGWDFINLIHPLAKIQGEITGSGNIIDRFSILNKGVKISSHNILLTGVVLGHDSIVGSGSFMGHNVIVNGHCRVEDQCFIGACSVIAPNVTIRNGTSLGIGSIVISDTEAGAKYMSKPAIKIGMS